jgi:hypothetical protein
VHGFIYAQELSFSMGFREKRPTVTVSVPTPIPVIKPIPINVRLVRQAAAEIAEAMGQVVQSMDPWQYPSLYSGLEAERDMILAKHKLHEAAVNLTDAAAMLRKAYRIP